MLAKYEEKDDYLAWNMLFKELTRLQGFDREDVEQPDYDKLQPPPVMVLMDPADIGVPVIDNLEEELRILRAPKGATRNTDHIDEAEADDDAAE